MKKIALSLPISDRYGWGICGLNLSKALNRVTGNQGAVTVFDPNPDSVLKFMRPVEWEPKYPFVVEETMLHAIQGPTMFPLNLLTWSKTRNIGLCFIEDQDLAAKYLEVAKAHFDHVITGSTWCTEQLRQRGFPSVSTAIQGVDSSVFHPGPETPPTDKFVIGSFGKFEYRKGQDIVIAAFKLLMDKCPDMHLVCGWGNLWPETMDSMAQSTLIQYPKVAGDWKTKIKATFLLNGISSARYTLLGMVPHEQMAAAYRGVHVGVFPSRCEAGTNLPMMEAMSCAVPVYCSPRSGHSDVLLGYPFSHEWGTELSNGCFELSPEHLAAAIEGAYANKELSFVGENHRSVVSFHTWDRMAESVLEYV